MFETENEYVGYEYLLAKEKGITIEKFDELVEMYLDFQRVRVKESSLYTVYRKAAKHIIPYFTGRYIADITPLDVVKWQASLIGLSQTYKRSLRTILGSVFAFGHKYFMLPNPVADVPPIKKTDATRSFAIWSKEEFDRFDAVAEDVLYKNFYRFLFITGCRKGEAFALAPSDIDPVRGTVSISKTLTKKCFGATYFISTPKTKSSIRTISIPTWFARDLLKLQANRSARFLFGGNAPISDSTMQRHFIEYADKAELRHIRIHDLRHSHASFLLSNGISVVAVSKRLGHSTVSMTLDVYAHVVPKDDELILRLF